MGDLEADREAPWTVDLAAFYVPGGREFREARLEIGVTQQAVADAAGTSQAAISKFERGGCGLRSSTLRRAVEFLREQQEVRGRTRLITGER